MVPDGWKEAQLGEFMSFKNGVNASKDAYGSGTKFVNVMDVFGTDRLYEGQIIGEMVVTDKQLQDYSVLYGDILFNRTSETQDEIALTTVYVDNKPAVFGGFVIRGRLTDERLLPDFAAYAFQSEDIRREMIRRGQGAVRANIGQKDLVKVSMLIPPKVEQEKIAVILTSMDQAIETTEKLIENSERQKKALMQQLLTGKKRLKGFSGEWVSKTLGEISSLYQPKTISQKSFTPDGYPVWGANGIIGKYPKFNHDTWQIMITCRGSTCGTVNRSQSKSWITGNAMVVNADGVKSIDKLFLYYYLSQCDFRSLIGGSGQPQITRKPLLKYNVKIPSDITEQIAIAEFLKIASSEAETLVDSLRNLTAEKTALMQQLLTGKRRVKVDGEVQDAKLAS